MNQNKIIILEDILGTTDITSSEGKRNLIFNFNDIDMAFQSYEEDFKNDPVILKDAYELHRDVSNLYRTIILGVIYEFAENEYNKSIDFVLTNNSQEDISLKLEKFLNSKGLPQQFRCDVYDNVKVLAERLNKRFSFDEITLINLIEASSGSNIILEEGLFRRNDSKVLTQTDRGYEFKSSTSKKVYTSDGKRILDPRGQETREREEIKISDFPMGNKFVNTNNAMRKVMEILFENLNLCIETYNSIYTSGQNVVKNSATLSDGTTFEFDYIVEESNIPHLLGFQRGNTLSLRSIEHLNIISKATGKPTRRDGSLILLSQNSSALDVLKVIYENQQTIIESNGLYEENGKLYEIINWEKVILKTSSFMRGDFFKTCFCLAKLAPNKYLVDSREKGGYVSIASTEYNKGLNTSKSTRAVLNDLLNTRRQKRDFIFRGFITRDNKQIVNSIMTGKSETIHVGKTNELLHTLQRYRDLFTSGDSGTGMETEEQKKKRKDNPAFNQVDKSALMGSIVAEIENEKFIRKFTPAEQAELGISISRDLSLVPHISLDALDILQGVHYQNGAVTEIELQEFDAVRRNGHTKK